tara:strand:- start:133 stop:555 length:423 start_codon:yes stop_codon:yes gene_type:complete
MSKFKLSKNSKNNIRGVEESIVKLVNRVLEKSEHDFGIPKNGGLRTSDDQRKLYKQRPRVTQLDGFRRKSYHQSGKAVDIFIYDEHGACWDCKDKYHHVADLMKVEFKAMQEEGLFKSDEELRWGGDWKSFTDLPHFEIR